MTANQTKTPGYQSWRHLKVRWGADLICDSWKEFKNFHSDMGDKPEGASLVRIDTQQCFCEKNCLWRLTKNKVQRTYSSWQGIMFRCVHNSTQEKKQIRYKNRGITVSEEWRVYANFLRDMGERPEGMSLDRVDNNLGYSKENCRWATPKQQNNNTSRTVCVEFEGKTYPQRELAELMGITFTTFDYYFNKKKLGVGESVRLAKHSKEFGPIITEKPNRYVCKRGHQKKIYPSGVSRCPTCFNTPKYRKDIKERLRAASGAENGE